MNPSIHCRLHKAHRWIQSGNSQAIYIRFSLTLFSHLRQLPNITAKWLARLLRIWDITDTNLSRENGYLNWGFLRFLPTPTRKCLNSSRLLRFTSFPIHYSLIIVSFDGI
jgi:hypothetical protein